MELVYKFGQMVRNMRVSGKITKHQEWGSFITLMVMFMKENGLTIKQMELEYIFILMVQNMKEIGRRMIKMVLGRKHGQTDRFMKGIIKKALKKELEFTVGQREAHTLDNGIIAK